MIYRSTILPAKYTIVDKRIAFFKANTHAIRAARFLKDNTNIHPILIGNYFSLQDIADSARISLKNIEIVKTASILNNTAQITAEVDPLISVIHSKSSKTELKDPLLFPIGLLNSGIADIYFFPNDIYIWKLIQAINSQVGYSISGFHILFSPDKKEPFLFSDTCINADPNAETLAETAIRSAHNYENLTDKAAKTALLSFSTKGSAKHAMTETVRNALDIVRKKAPSLTIDGELQFDAAAAAEVSALKAPESVLKGDANVFIFPNLNSARIGYQIARSIAEMQSYGGFIQGLNSPLVLSDREATYMELVETAQLSIVYNKN